MARRIAFALAVAVCCAASVAALPSMPSGYTALLNTTVVFSAGQQATFLQTNYQGYNNTLMVSYTPGGTPYQLSDGNDQTSVKFNPATKQCQTSCLNGDVCPNGKCGVYGAGTWGPLTVSKPNGKCTFDISGATRYTFSFSSDGSSVDLEYCFVGNQPVYVLEQVTAASEGAAIPAAVEERRHLRSVAPAVGGDTPTMVLMVVLELKTETPNADTFDVPVYCKCAASA